MKRELYLFIFISFILALSIQSQAANSYSISYGATTTIDEFGTCKMVTNNLPSTRSLFVPTKTTGEWSNFRSHVPNNVSVADCCGSYSSSCTSGTCCSGLYCDTGGGSTCLTQIPLGGRCQIGGPADQCASGGCFFDGSSGDNCCGGFCI